MTCAARILQHSENLRQTHNVLRNDRATFIRWFASDARPAVNKVTDISRASQLDGSGGKHGISKFSRRGCSSPVHLISGVGAHNGNALLTAMKLQIPVIGISREQKSARSFSTDSGLPPRQEIGMPSLSPTMMEANIVRWLKKEGDKVSPGEVLCEVETDKATVEMECMEEGYLAKILCGDGSSGIKVGELIAITVEEEEDVMKFKDYTPTPDDGPSPKEPSAPAPPEKETAEEPVTSSEQKISKPSAPSSAGDRIVAGPLARKLAEDHKVSLSDIKGTGPDGRIVEADIEDFLASHGKDVSQAPKVDTTISAALDYIDIPHTQNRKVIASWFLQSKQTIPHYCLTVNTCVDKLMELRGQLNLLQEASGGEEISFNDLVIKASALALRKVPECNSSWTNDYICQYNNVNIYVAVNTDHGDFAALIRDADKKGLSKIADEVKQLTKKAKENSLRPEDYEGGTFTVANLGLFDVEQFCAVIIPPQSGILAVGSVEKRVIPGAGPDQYNFASFMSVTLSCDHRVIDGAIGAEWLKAFKGYIENPKSMLL